ncbi:MAG: SRPBCC domain-containing protein [Acidobacteriota bacterium]
MTEALAQEPTVLHFDQEIDIQARPEDVFKGMIQRLTEDHHGGPHPLPLRLERRPGGRWYRDLGDDQGHLWGFVQSYRPPTLLELYGPMFMSYPVAGHMIIRFHATDQGTRLAFRYSAFGLLQDDHREGIQQGFRSMLEAVQQGAES